MNNTIKIAYSKRGRILASIAMAILLTALAALPCLAVPTKTGTAAVSALKSNGSGDASMMASLLGPSAALEETGGKVYAVIELRDGKIMGIGVDCTKIRDVKSYDGDTAYPAEDVSKTDGSYKVRVLIPDINADTVLKLTPPVMNIEQTVLLRLNGITWSEPVATTEIISTTITLIDATVTTAVEQTETSMMTKASPASAEPESTAMPETILPEPPTEEAKSLSPGWTLGGIVALAALFVLLLVVQPKLRKRALK